MESFPMEVKASYTSRSENEDGIFTWNFREIGIRGVKFTELFTVKDMDKMIS